MRIWWYCKILKCVILIFSIYHKDLFLSVSGNKCWKMIRSSFAKCHLVMIWSVTGIPKDNLKSRIYRIAERSYLRACACRVRVVTSAVAKHVGSISAVFSSFVCDCYLFTRPSTTANSSERFLREKVKGSVLGEGSKSMVLAFQKKPKVCRRDSWLLGPTHLWRGRKGNRVYVWPTNCGRCYTLTGFRHISSDTPRNIKIL